MENYQIDYDYNKLRKTIISSMTGFYHPAGIYKQKNLDDEKKSIFQIFRKDEVLINFDKYEHNVGKSI